MRTGASTDTTTWVVVAISAAIAACAPTTPTERERALAKLPAQAQLIGAANGPALSALRPVVDAARPFIPAKLGCVVDVALTSEAVAVAVAPAVGATIVVITRAHVGPCPALSRIDDDTFVATIGAGTVAKVASVSPLGDARWARVRSYLVDDPVAIAIDRDGQRVLAVAQPKPLAGWVTIDSVAAPLAERRVRAWIDGQRATALAPFAGALVARRRGSQLLVRATKPQAEQLALAVVELLRSLDVPAPTPTPTFALACSGDNPEVVRCSGSTALVRSLSRTLRLIAERTEVVVAGGEVIGIRLTDDHQMLRRGDLVLGLDGHAITSGEQLTELGADAKERVTLAVRRADTDVVIELRE